ncbi:hypothetical protein HYV74_00300 [Candidatus Uhrbacteria bacterium]|nr:hypothetical protein [Candidatus Uhrbacteria bacterium]
MHQLLAQFTDALQVTATIEQLFSAHGITAAPSWSWMPQELPGWPVASVTFDHQAKHGDRTLSWSVNWMADDADTGGHLYINLALFPAKHRDPVVDCYYHIPTRCWDFTFEDRPSTCRSELMGAGFAEGGLPNERLPELCAILARAFLSAHE